MGIRKNLEGLKILAMELSKKGTIQVGIFGSKGNRLEAGEKKKQGGHKTIKGSQADETNAEIGLLMEVGSVSKHIPPRSFLQMPLRLHGDEIMKDAKAEVSALANPGGIMKFLKVVGVACENVIQQAFATRGFGYWAKNAPLTIASKGSDSPLIDTGQLRRAIASRVKV